ncbi:preprotein translocase subunit SecE [Candidatus Peregrinibacteria bacterium]|nr:preprotein translocase subunit SecE [Candidatus Peregrinibacteria bacterium]
MFNSIKLYFQESLHELHNVTWPTRKQAIRITTIVLVFLLVAAAALGVVDQLLAAGYKYLLSIR